VRAKITPSPVAGVVPAPPSKSYTHRAVIIGSLATGETKIQSPLMSDDTLYTIEACRLLGVDIKHDENELTVTGSGGQLHTTGGEPVILVGNSGTTLRLVAGLAALAPARVILDGDTRLRQRPVGDLLMALNSLGIPGCSLTSNNCPPIEIRGGRLSGGKVTMRGLVSSQPISSLLLIAPYTKNTLSLKVTGKLHSRPYITITLDIMRDFGVNVVNHDFREFIVESGQAYRGRLYIVEGDYSSAAYFLAAGAIGGGPVTVANLKINSQQGDRHFLTILSEMGCSVEYQGEEVKVSRSRELTGITVDMGDYPDIVPTLAMVAAYANGQTKISNIGHLKFKETDRISNTATELAKMGIKTKVTEDTMVVHGGRPKGAEIESYNDHRMNMSFATAALFADGTSVINGAEAVTKSYPQFLANLANLGAKIEALP
jgi:3-phosphoshikimate 1-carboxyvinyltransferase